MITFATLTTSFIVAQCGSLRRPIGCVESAPCIPSPSTLSHNSQSSLEDGRCWAERISQVQVKHAIYKLGDDRLT